MIYMRPCLAWCPEVSASMPNNSPCVSEAVVVKAPGMPRHATTDASFEVVGSSHKSTRTREPDSLMLSIICLPVNDVILCCGAPPTYDVFRI